MPIPQYQEFMTPALKLFKDMPHSAKEILPLVCEQLHISQEEQQEMLPSQMQTIVQNRLNWALIYMYNAGLLVRVKRGVYQISPSGQDALKSGKTISNNFLSTYPAFQEFKARSRKTEDKNTEPAEQNTDPTTRINNAIEDFNQRTRRDLLEQLKATDPIYFERICLELMKAMGYGDEISLTAKSHDGGIDGIVNEDALGLDKIYLQAKRYADNKVNGKEMRDFLGGITDKKTRRGVFITTSYFDKTAQDIATRNNIIMIDGNKLTALLLKYNVGVRIKETYYIKEVDWEFFADDEWFTTPRTSGAFSTDFPAYGVSQTQFSAHTP